MQVEEAVVRGCGIHLEIAGVNHHTKRRVDGQRDAIHQAVRDLNGVDGERPDGKARSRPDFIEHGLFEQAMFFELLPGTPLITRDNLDSLKTDNVVNAAVNPSEGVLTAEALGIKLTTLESVAPAYLAPTGQLDELRSRARHAHLK